MFRRWDPTQQDYQSILGPLGELEAVWRCTLSRWKNAVRDRITKQLVVPKDHLYFISCTICPRPVTWEQPRQLDESKKDFTGWTTIRMCRTGARTMTYSRRHKNGDVSVPCRSVKTETRARSVQQKTENERELSTATTGANNRVNCR